MAVLRGPSRGVPSYRPHLLNTAVAWRCIRENPIAGMRALRHDAPAKQRRTLSLAEVRALFEHSPPLLRPVWLMLMTTGLRKRELIELVFDDVDFARRTVMVRATSAKNHKPREVPLSDEMLATITLLRDQAALRRPMGHRDRRIAAAQRAAFSRDHIFVTRANTPWRNNLLSRFYSCCRRAGIAGAEPGGSVDLHSLRVSFVTLALEHGAAPRAVQEIVGHSTLAMTMGVYARVTDRGKRQAIASLPFAQFSALEPRSAPAQVSAPGQASAPEPGINAPAVRKLCAKSKPSPQRVTTPVLRQLTIGL